MKVLGEPTNSVFPMQIVCRHQVDREGYSYGSKADFCGRPLEIEEGDVKKHPWSKYPDYHGVDYGIICPICRMFTTIDEDKLPKHVKENAKEIRLTRGRYEGSLEDLQENAMDKTFRFEYLMSQDISAENVGEAMDKFRKLHQDIGPNNLRHIYYNGRPLPYEYSEKTREQIYYVPGCSCGNTDCIMDPMRDIARKCSSQSDMTADKWISCSEKVPEGSDCPYYDDECK